MEQIALFDGPSCDVREGPEGLDYEPGWLRRDEEANLIALCADLPFESARYKGYTARRRVVGYGGRFDFDRNRLETAAPLIEALHPLRQRVADWAGTGAARLSHVLVSEYLPGTPLGWHRDVPDFEDIVGVSFGAAATLRFRPFPVRPDWARHAVRRVVAPRSIYRMRGPARWAWQHSVLPVGERRWSITFRTRR